MSRFHAGPTALHALLIILATAAVTPVANAGYDYTAARVAAPSHYVAQARDTEAQARDIDLEAQERDISEPAATVRPQERTAAQVDTIEISKGPHPLVFERTSTLAANPEYHAGALHSFLLGERYRSAWTERIEVPTIDLEESSGGLTVTGSAGGLQTSLLFLEGEDGRHYVLRTLDKDGGEALPEVALNTIVEDISQDQVSALHPYGAFILPVFAEAAGLLYTHPVLVRVPDSPRLGEHRNEFAGQFALIERNVTEDVSEEARFGYAEEIIDTEELYERVESSPHHFVDERAYLKTRLFDMLIGDRDRHDGQFFWAAFEEDGRTRYEPIPIDRDFAFARFEGLLPRLGRATGSPTLKRMTNFDEDINNLIGLNFQAAKLDYRFTSGLDLDDWIAIAEELQRDISDDVIDRAVHAWPDPVVKASGDVTITDFTSRRDRLAQAAEEYYEIMARRVDVIGTAADERYTITRTGPETVEITVSMIGGILKDESASFGASFGDGPDGASGPAAARSKPSVFTSYQRTFDEDATEEIRLFGLGGDDRFVVSGDEVGGIKVRIVGGAGNDELSLDSRIRQDLIYFYDTELPDRSDVGRVELKMLPDSASNSYVMHRYELSATAPVFSFDYDSDQGLFLGGGVRFVRFGFRKEPYSARHSITANYAPRSKGYNVEYDGHVVDLIGGWDAVMTADVVAEDTFRDFYGLGNETPEANRDLFGARFQWITALPGLERTFWRNVSARIGPYYEWAQISAPEGLSVGDPQVGFTEEQMTERHVVGLRTRIEVDGRDSTMMPHRGVRFIAEAGVQSSLSDTNVRFARFASQLSAYQSLGPLTLALRAGGATNVGEFAFHQANFLGGGETIRGFNSNRFAGRSSAYGNAELRLDVSEFNIYLVRGHLGALGFVDAGRVWVDDEDSDVLHTGYGGGLWITPYDQFVMTGTLGFSDDGTVFDLSFDLFF